MITMTDVIYHIDGCVTCAHLVSNGTSQNFSQELLEKAVIAAHSKKPANT